MAPMRLRLKPATWLALIAVLALALMPTISRALAFARGDASWAEVCTMQGLKLASMAADGGNEAPAAERAQLEHCAFCALSAGTAPLPAAPVVPFLLPASTTEPPALFLHAPRTLFAWSSAQPRAPPLFS